MTQRSLDDIEQDIAAQRFRYLRAVDACHDGEAEAYEIRIDALLDEWDMTKLALRKRRVTP